MISQFVIAALLVAQATPAPPQPCVTKQEAGDLAVVILPMLIDDVAQRCATHLPATAFLRAGAPAFSQRIKADGVGRRDSAMRAMQRMLGQSTPTGIPPELMLQTFVAGMMSGLKNLNTESCTELSRMVESVSPLPPANLAQLVSSSLGFFVSRSGPNDGPPICRS